MREIGVGVIGVGRMGELFSRILVQLAQAKLVGVADIDENRARQVGKSLGVPWYGSTEELLAQKGIEAVVIATSDQWHLAPALAAADAGKHIFIEKPLATTVDEAKQIITAVNSAGVCMMVGHTLRFDPKFILAQQAIEAGKVGEVAHIYARRNTGMWNARRLGGRTSLPFFLGVHDIDVMHWFTGDRIARVFAKSVNRVVASEFGVSDAVVSLLVFDSGIVAVLENSWVQPAGPSERVSRMVEVVGTSGVIQLSPGTHAIGIYFESSVEYPETVTRFDRLVFGKVVGPYRDELDHFLHCVTTGDPPAVTGEDGLAAVVVAAAIEESLSEGTEVTISWEA